MPDYTPQPEQQQARLTAQLDAAKIAAAVERCGMATTVERCPGILSWVSVGSDLMTAEDGRYTVQLLHAGWIGRVHHDGEVIHESRPCSMARYAREICEAFESGVRFCTRVIEAAVVPDMERTAEHEVLRYEVMDGID